MSGTPRLFAIESPWRRLCDAGVLVPNLAAATGSVGLTAADLTRGAHAFYKRADYMGMSKPSP